MEITSVMTFGLSVRGDDRCKWPSLILAREDRKATALVRQQGYSTVLQDMRRKHRRHSVSVPCSRTFRSFGGISKMSEIKLWSKYVKVI